MSSHNYSTDEPLDGDGWDDADGAESSAGDDGLPDLGPLDSHMPSLNGNGSRPVPPLPPTLPVSQSSNGSDHVPNLEELAVAAGLSSDEISRLGLPGSDEGQHSESANTVPEAATAPEPVQAVQAAEGDGDEALEAGLFDTDRPPARRVLHPFDVPVEATVSGPPDPPPSMSTSNDYFDYGQPETPMESGRVRAPITDEVPVVAPPPAPHTMSTSLISGGIGDAPVGDPVDQIAVRKLGGFNFLSIPQWMAMPKDEKARLIKGELVTFMYEGEEVSLRAALLYLQSLNRDDSDRHDRYDNRW